MRMDFFGKELLNMWSTDKCVMNYNGLGSKEHFCGFAEVFFFFLPSGLGLLQGKAALGLY